MSQSISKPLQDIPLSVDELAAVNVDDDKRPPPSKTNSLRRFFKLPHKRHSGGTISNDEDDDDNGETKISTKKSNSRKDKAEQEASASRTEPQRRFHLRLGGNRLDSGVNSSNAIDAAAGGSSSSSSGISKPSLKSSISNYWNAVFKRQPSDTDVSEATLMAASTTTSKYLGTATSTDSSNVAVTSKISANLETSSIAKAMTSGTDTESDSDLLQTLKISDSDSGDENMAAP